MKRAGTVLIRTTTEGYHSGRWQVNAVFFHERPEAYCPKMFAFHAGTWYYILNLYLNRKAGTVRFLYYIGCDPE